MANFARGRGCGYCHHTGYRGRKGIFEMMAMNSAIREMTFNREPTQTIRKRARQTGMRPQSRLRITLRLDHRQLRQEFMQIGAAAVARYHKRNLRLV